eukprot:TRINITY_DN22851_c0_g1_i1.p1 TRINITY_DN22851_c0_g1~~TRINITY_DN22851_c0_g1_i1.p1  ORF type:complete len:207 (+),score=32.68 TRINITY_DN22851_c0_g1_i1:64-684(+)
MEGATVAASACSTGLLPSFEGLRAQCSSSVKLSANASTSAPMYYQPLVITANKKAQKRRQIVLMEDVQYLGKSGELLAVKPGYFRNYLYPFGKAKLATVDILKGIRLEEERQEAERQKVKKEAEDTAKQFQTIGGFKVQRKAGAGKQIFGSVTTQDISDIIKANTGKEIDKRIITLPEIREVGQYVAEIKLHPEVIAQVRINVIGK